MIAITFDYRNRTAPAIEKCELTGRVNACFCFLAVAIDAESHWKEPDTVNDVKLWRLYLYVLIFSAKFIAT